MTRGRRGPVRRLAHIAVVGAAAAAWGATLHSIWNARELRTPPPDPTTSRERVRVLLPVRDEVHHVGACLTALRAQTGVDDLHIVVIDDRSSDATPDVVQQHVDADPRVTLLRGTGEPPPGWIGKPWACQRLAEAVGDDADVLVFVDADVRLEPHAVAASVELLRTAGLDLVSPYPRQLAVTWPERLVQPLLQWSWLTFLPLRAAERSSRPSLSAANGQLLVVDAAAYREAGGHTAVRDAVLEDIAFVVALKEVGRRGVVVDGTHLARCRMYDGWPAVRDGYTKSLWSAFGSTPGAVGVAALLAWMYVLPPVAALTGSRAGWIGYAGGVTGRVVAARRTGARGWPDVLAHPASVATFDLLVLRSLRARRSGTLRWKGRLLTASARPPVTSPSAAEGVA